MSEREELEQRYNELLGFTTEVMKLMGELYTLFNKMEELSGNNQNHLFATWIQFNWKHHQKEIKFPQ